MLKDLASGLNGGPSVGLQKGHGFHRTTALSTGLPCGGPLPTQAWGIVPPPAGVPVEHHLGPICLLGPLSLALPVTPGETGGTWTPTPQGLGLRKNREPEPSRKPGLHLQKPTCMQGKVPRKPGGQQARPSLQMDDHRLFS